MQSQHAASKAATAVDGGKASFHYGSSTTGKTDQETQSPVLKIFTDMLAREKSFQGYRGIPLKRHKLHRAKSSDPEKAALLRAEHKRDRDSKRDDRWGDDRKDDGKSERDSDERKRRSAKKNKKPKKRSASNPKSNEKKEKKKVKSKISCHCPKSSRETLICDDACCQYDGECQSSSKEDVVLEDKRETRLTTTTTREQDVDDDGDRIYEQRERVRERNFKRKMDDTCSCASCVSLKKMCRNDCVCYCCVAFIFIFCLFLAFVLVCKSIPCLKSKFTVFGTSDDLEADRLKRKIDVPADMQWDGLDKKQRISNKWDYDRLPGHPVPHSVDSKSYGDLNLYHDSELMKIIDPDKLSEIQSNERLREFYKKLVSTDAEIRKLKKNYLFNVETINSVPYPDRAKRSLDVLKNPFRMFHPKKKKINETTTSKTTGAAKENERNTERENKDNPKETKDARIKRFNADEDGLLIEKKKVSIQFLPNGRRAFKCSHAPKEINSYEKQVKNPFYQNTQRLDELLDRFLDKNVMDMMGEPYSRALIAMKKCKQKNKNSEEKIDTPTIKFKEEKGDFEVSFNDAKNKMLKNSFRNNNYNNNKNMNDNNNNNYNNNNRNIQRLPEDDNFKSLDDQLAKIKLMADYYSKNNQRTDTDALQDFLNSHGGEGKAKITTSNTNKENALKKGNTETTTRNYNLLMSISTMMYKDTNNPSPTKKPDDSHKVTDRAPVGRRLMQIKMDDDEEVPVMPASERDGERRTRREDETNPNNLINPNWKGPMPLYPDEVNSLNKPGPVIVTTEENPETESILFPGPKNRKLYRFKCRGSADSKDPGYLADMEYIEDYFRNKYDMAAEMAQAYSDYGVLNDKNIKSQQRVDQRFRNYGKVDTARTPEIKIVGVEKSPASSSTEEFRLNILPSSSHFDGMFKAIRKHIKFTGAPEPERSSTTERPLEPFFNGNSFETTKNAVLDVKNILKVEKPTNMEFESRNIKKRSLKSIDYYQNDDAGDAIESLMNFRGIFNGLQKKFSSKLGSAQDYAIRVASDYIHDGIFKRDVDSVDVDALNDSIADDNITVSDNTTEYENISDIFNKTEALNLIANDTEISTAQTIDTAVKIATGDIRNDTGTTLSDFFMKLSHWFSLLDSLDLNVEGNFSATNNTNEKAKNQPKIELSFPLYDSDMIENIGHRSRVLLAVKETEIVDDSTPDGAGKGVGDTKGVGVVGAEIENTTTANLETLNAKDHKTKTIVKRNADGNLFWNDIYNDDYGADADNIDGNDASKHVPSYASKPAEKKHNRKDWFKKLVNKFKEGAANFEHKKGGANKEGSHRNCDKCEEGKPKPKPKQELGVVASRRRVYRKADSDYPTEEKKTDFTALTAKMKKICQKAAKDISLSKKLEVREETKEGQVASKLMQQLIGLMSDLVNYQVHEKTCRKLPVDLQNFLEWLTNPESTVMTYHGKDTILAQNNKEPLEDIHTLEAMPPDEEMPEPKADYMSVMSSVRDLLNRYDSMSEDDKSKMSGVREYLEAQIEYLQKQLYNDFDMYNTDISRFKRNAKVSEPRHHLGKVNSVYVTFRKYMKKQNNGGNKLTKNLHPSDKASTTSKIMTIAVAIDENAPTKAKSVKSKKDKVVKKITKRNLKDVYYRALEEAKLMTVTTVEAKLTTALFPKTTDFLQH